MPLYTISYTIKGDGFTLIEAESAEAAREKFEQGDWEQKGDSLEHTFTGIEEDTSFC
jgi:hypothetical protein